MTSEESKRAASQLAKLFPGKLSRAQGDWLAIQLRPFAFDAATEAINAHREGRQKPDMDALLDGLRAAKATAGQRPERTWFEIQRSHGPHLRDACDAEVALRVHRQWWHQCSKSPGYRRQLAHQCAAQLTEAGIAEDRAAIVAQEIFGDSPEHFRRVLADLRYATADAAADPFA